MTAAIIPVWIKNLAEGIRPGVSEALLAVDALRDHDADRFRRALQRNGVCWTDGLIELRDVCDNVRSGRHVTPDDLMAFTDYRLVMSEISEDIDLYTDDLTDVEGRRLAARLSEALRAVYEQILNLVPDNDFSAARLWLSEQRSIPGSTEDELWRRLEP